MEKIVMKLVEKLMSLFMQSRFQAVVLAVMVAAAFIWGLTLDLTWMRLSLFAMWLLFCALAIYIHVLDVLHLLIMGALLSGTVFSAHWLGSTGYVAACLALILHVWALPYCWKKFTRPVF